MDNTPMNTSHVVGASGAVGLLTEVFVYLTHWPLQPMDTATAGSFAALTIMVCAPFLAARLNRIQAKPPEAPNA